MGHMKRDPDKRLTPIGHLLVWVGLILPLGGAFTAGWLGHSQWLGLVVGGIADLGLFLAFGINRKRDSANNNSESPGKRGL
jgi:hypothetical protein